MNRIVLFCCLISAVLLSGCQTPFSIYEKAKPIRPFKVQLEVENTALVNNKKQNDKCTEFDDLRLRKGCFVAEHNEVLELQFTLKKRSEGARGPEPQQGDHTRQPHPDERPLRYAFQPISGKGLQGPRQSKR